MTEEGWVADGSGATDGANRLGHESERSTPAARPPLASLLAEAGVASEAELRLAVAEGMGSGERLGEIVLRRGWIDEAGLARLLARQWELAYLDEEAAVADPGVSGLLSAPDAERLGACVIGRLGDRLRVAVAEPTDARFARVQAALGQECEFVVVTRSALERLIAQRASDETEAQSRAAASSIQAAEDAETERLWDELDAAARRLTEWGERVKRVVELRQQSERELAQCRAQMSALEDELANQRAAVARLENELAHQNERVNAAKAKLADATRALAAE
jgi:type II secretion system (T2SS) protein E